MSKRVILLSVAVLTAIAATLSLYVGTLHPGPSVAANGARPPVSAGTTAATAEPAAPPAIPALPPPVLRAAPVSVNTTGFWSWTLLNRHTGELTGSTNQHATNYTASMIKAWLAADYLRRAAEKGTNPPSATMRQLTVMIRDSNNAAASSFWRLNGRSATIARLVKMCGLTDSKAHIDWAHTQMSSRDSARMAACIGDGRAAGPKWTGWVLNEMRSVRGVGRFGIISALPADVASQTAIKNGWIARTDGKWHINCMAVGSDWALAIMLVYPANKGMSHGTGLCKTITEQLRATPA